MDQTPLVNSDIEIEGMLVSALSHDQIPVTAVDWNWEPQLEEWQLTVVTPMADAHGPRETYGRILAALSLAEVYKSVPFKRIFVKSPNDPVAQKLIQELKRKSEGSIHIVMNRTTNGLPQYSLVFAPYVGRGGAIPSRHLAGGDNLRGFLEKRLSIDPYVVDQALAELDGKRSATIFNVQLNLRQARKLNLAA